MALRLPVITIDDVRPFYDGADPAHDDDHVLRVVTLAERIGRAEGADLSVVCTAALLHDIARRDEGSTGEDHAIASARKAQALLVARGASAGFADAVASAIRDHRFRAGRPPQTLEGMVLYDADKLDAIGAIGVARAYVVGGRLGQRLWSDVDAAQHIDPGAPFAIPDDHTPVREFVVKLARLKDTLHTAEARRIARARHRFMLRFFERLASEVKGLD
jgi:uncharacterized protein